MSLPGYNIAIFFMQEVMSAARKRVSNTTRETKKVLYIHATGRQQPKQQLKQVQQKQQLQLQLECHNYFGVIKL